MHGEGAPAERSLSGAHSLARGDLSQGSRGNGRRTARLATSVTAVLRLLHISDIHFSPRWSAQPNTDIEAAVRERMLKDFGVMAERLGQMDGILVVGDIANTGQIREYEIASRFLEAASELVGCVPNRVVCVPGNHDVERGAQSTVRAALQYKLQDLPDNQVSDALQAMLTDEEAADSLFRPLSAYNSFALAFGCDIGPDRIVFPAKTFPLGKRTVEVHGITSIWTSDGSDSATDDRHKLLAGLFQMAPIARDPAVVTITLCHHPARWLRDAQLLDGWLARAQLVLTGHEHEAGIRQSVDGRTLYVASGAVNPSRGEDGWIPAYNVIELHDPQDGTLEVSVYTRTWQVKDSLFGPEPGSGDPSTFSLTFGNARPLTGTQDSPTPPAVASLTVAEPEAAASTTRAYAHTVMGFAPDLRHRSARELGLLTDDGLDALDADRQILANAIRGDKLAELVARLMEG